MRIQAVADAARRRHPDKQGSHASPHPSTVYDPGVLRVLSLGEAVMRVGASRRDVRAAMRLHIAAPLATTLLIWLTFAKSIGVRAAVDIDSAPGAIATAGFVTR